MIDFYNFLCLSNEPLLLLLNTKSMTRLFLVIFLLSPLSNSAQKPGRIQIVPDPVSYESKQGSFHLSTQTAIILTSADPEIELAANYLAARLRSASGFELPITVLKSKKQKVKPVILFQKDATDNLHPEGYVLSVEDSQITIKSSSGAGAFYAVQSLLQLFPPQVFSGAIQKEISWDIQKCDITDYPRFGYRGLHLDVGRHWFPVPFIKKYIDLLAIHKMNRFHWHLTEDQGWRIEIKKYPRLQEMAACREKTIQGHNSDQPQSYDNTRYCHFYTQEEVKEIVEYARQRFITIVPEIEMPGHALAALTAYPELGCEGAGYQTATKWGVFEDVFCAGNEKVYNFIDGVMSEITGLFPGEYVHIGGDECPKTRWEECASCQKTIKNEKLHDEHELQSYFIRRAEKILAKYGKKLIGWDEILEGGLAPTATVMSWRGIEGGIAAAKAGHDAIMTPGSHCYFDFYQSDPASEPLAIGGFLTLEKVYSYEPIPAELTPEQGKHILGAQGNVWTEYITTPDKAEYMAYPRASALAEVVWSPKENRNWEDFRLRIRKHFQILDALNVNYARSFFDVSSQFSMGKVSLTCADPSVQIRYTTNGSEPTLDSPIYSSPFTLDHSSTIKASAWQGGRLLGKTYSNQLTIHKATGKPYTLSAQPNTYKGGEQFALTNGISGNMRTWNAWVGISGKDLDPTIDLGEITTVNRVYTNYVNSKQSWIHPPKSIEVLVSDDGINFKSLELRKIDPEEKMNSGKERILFSLPGIKTRFIKLVATNAGTIPEGYPGSGQSAWLFLDEVVVE